MEQFGVGNVSFSSLDPLQDNFAYWLWCLGFWNTKIVESIEKSGLVLPTELIEKFRLIHKLPFDKKTNDIFVLLLDDMNGLFLSRKEISKMLWKDTSHPYGHLNQLSLVRVQDNCLLKPKKIAFDSRVQYMVGVSKLD